MASSFLNLRFENDVNQYGSYTMNKVVFFIFGFENDVNQYGSYTSEVGVGTDTRLRMM